MKLINWLFGAYKDSRALQVLLFAVICGHIGIALAWYFVWLVRALPNPFH